MVKEEYRDNKIVSYVTKEEKEQIIEKAKILKCTIAQLIRFSVFNLSANFSNLIDIKRLKPHSKPILDNKRTNNFRNVITEMKEAIFKRISLKKVPEKELKKAHSYKVHEVIMNKSFFQQLNK